MDKNAIKKYAVWARNELIARVAQKALQYGITEENIVDAGADSINGKLLTNIEKIQRQALITQIKDKGFEQVIEEVAYTWFNRFSALRFMEVNGYLPTHVRVFTDEENNFKPQIITEAIHLEMDGLDMEKVYAFKDADNTEELYKYLLITQCNALNKILPGMFQKIADYTELLLPDNLLREGSVIQRMIVEIPEDNFDISSENGQVEIIGWLYQYYNDEKKNEVININKGTVKKEDVPAATQLFTTDWVVRYIIDNSVGRYWIERNPDSALSNELEYFVVPKNGIIPTVNESITPQELTVFDPCMGSAHFLIYAFEVLMKIYVEYGYSEREAALEIVQNNIYGLDIDDRASQLAYFAVMMKARQYDRRFFTRSVQPHVFAVSESNHLDTYAIEYFCANNEFLRKDMNVLLLTMKDAKEFGTIIQVPQVDFDAMNSRFEQIEEEISIYKEVILNELYPFVHICEIMSKKYAVVATNPPYLNKYDAKLKKYLSDNYKDYAGDLFSVFIYRNFSFCKNDGYSGFMTPFVWMFIKTYDKLRDFIITEKSIVSLVQMEYSAFEEATVPICSFVLKNKLDDGVGYYFKLSEFKGGMQIQKKKVIEALSDKDCGFYYETAQTEFKKIDGAPIAYWASRGALSAFESSPTLGSVAIPKQGMATTDNGRFLRQWYEVSFEKIGFGFDSNGAKESGIKWFPLNKGGEYRKWYGNNLYVVNYKNDGEELIKTVRQKYERISDPEFVIKNRKFYFKENGTWSAISSGDMSVRYSPPGFIISNAGMAIYNEEHLKYIIAFLNSNCSSKTLIKMVNQSINFNAGDLERLPFIIDKENYEKIILITNIAISISKSDWDSFETSWDFSSHPLLPAYADTEENSCKLSSLYEEWERCCRDRFNKLKVNEEELNRMFIDIYGLQADLTPEVEEKDVTVRLAEKTRDIKSLISFAVGCMFGRYSLGNMGLTYAGGEWDDTKYNIFSADKDNIIPICDDEYFNDDIVGKFIEFMSIAYGESTLQENLKFVADALGGKGNPKDVIRNYFLNDFYNDHCKMYQKRPIYWQFDSGKKNGFKCLIYIHRYQPDTVARIRTDYVHEQQSRYRTAIADLEQRINGASASERVKLNKQLQKLQSQEAEVRSFEEKVHHLADQMIRIDLDDGVKNNYEIFKDVLAKIK